MPQEKISEGRLGYNWGGRLDISQVDGVLGSPLEDDLDSLVFKDLARKTAYATAPSGWIEEDIGPYFSLAQETSDFQDGASAVKIVATNATFGSGEIRKDVSAVSGKIYRVSGSYQCNGSPAQLDARVLVCDASETYVSSDGRTNVSAESYVSLLWTGDSIWRRFTFEFRAPGNTLRVRLRLAWLSGVASGSVLFDKVTVKRVWRQDTYEPRIASSGVSPLQTGSPGIFFSGKTVGSGNIELLNADAGLDLALGQLTWIGQTIQHFVGGSVPDLGIVDRDEWDQRFTGLIQEFESEDMSRVNFSLEDIRTRFHKQLPPNFNSTLDTNIAENDRGAVKPLLFGGKTSIRPQRIGFDPLLKYGQYLIADCTDAPNGIQSIDAIYAYEDEDAATKLDSTSRIAMLLPTVEKAPTFMTFGIVAKTFPTSFQVTLQKVASSGFTDNVSSSHDVLYGDGYVEFLAGGSTTSSVVVGLADVWDHQVLETDIDYGFHLNAGTMRIIENGVQKLATTAYTGITKFRVNRTGNTITYLYDLGTGAGWQTYYTSLTTFTGPLSIKVGISTTSGFAFAISCVGFGHVSTDLTTAQFTVREHVGPIRVTLDNQFLNWDYGSSELTAKVPVGLYTAVGLAKTITEQMKAQASSSFMSCTYDQATQKFVITRLTAGTLNLRINSGTNKDASIWGLLGWDRSANDTGATSYTADNFIWDVTSIDSNHIIRCDARGYKDDSLGTYTGTANSLIQRGCDIVKALTIRWMKYPASTVVESYIVKARTLAASSLAIYHREQISSQVIFERIESSNLANIIIGGDGLLYFIVYDYNNETVPLHSRLEERDHIAMPRWRKKVEEVFRDVIVLYDQRPDNDVWKFTSASDPSVSNKYQRIEPKQVETYIRFQTVADVLAQRTLVLAQRPPVRVTVTTNTKLFRRRIGDIVSLTRRRALNAQGSAVARPFRIISIAPEPIAGTVEADLVEAATLPSGYNCLSSCQELCQLEKQNECAFQVQVGCAVACQEPCQVSVQGCGFTVCQVGCEGTCQVCGESTACQTTCQLSCQATCELSAQGCGTCQAGCQAHCQTNCQDCGQGSNCQTCGQLIGCQNACQTHCQDCGQAGHCQIGCETSCEDCGQAGHCQTGCQLSGCQTPCEFSCQTAQGPDIPF